MGWRYPFGCPGVKFSGGPAAGGEFPVVGLAGEGEFVDVGQTAGGPFGDMVDLGEVAGDVAARGCAAAVSVVQHDALVGGGDALAAAQIERTVDCFESTKAIAGDRGPGSAR